MYVEAYLLNISQKLELNLLILLFQTVKDNLNMLLMTYTNQTLKRHFSYNWNFVEKVLNNAFPDLLRLNLIIG